MDDPPAVVYDSKVVDAPLESGERKRWRGVTKHRRSGRYEAHVWVKSIGKQLYLGGYSVEADAAEAYDIAVLYTKKHEVGGPKLNYPVSKYAELIPLLDDDLPLNELVMSIRRQSQTYSRGTSTFRGVCRHPSGRWEARIGVPGCLNSYLGLFDGEVDAARAYDRAILLLKGSGAATNFDAAEYGTQA